MVFNLQPRPHANSRDIWGGRPDYNFIIHNAPCSNEVGDFYHWHIEFMPVLARVAGFEWGTGFYINPISPEESVQSLKSV